MPMYPSVYRAKSVKYDPPVLTAYVPQVFGDVPIEITDVIGSQTPGMGWVFFQGGDPDFPVWNGGVGGGGGTVSDVVWTGPDAPTDSSIELWWDTDAEVPLDPRYLTPSDADALYLTQAEVDARVATLLSPAWITLPYATGWEHYPGFQVPGYRKVGDLVYLRGVTRIKTPLTATSTVCTLPSGYRPSGAEVLNVRCGEPNATARLDINAAGLVVLSLLTIAVGNWISLSGVTFSTTA